MIRKSQKKLISVLFDKGRSTITEHLKHIFEKTGVRAVEGYGLTEAAPVVLGNPPFGEDRDAQTAARDGVDVRLLVPLKSNHVVADWISRGYTAAGGELLNGLRAFDVLRGRPDVNCAVHVHTETGMALAGLRGGLRMVSQQAMRFYQRVGYHPYEGITEDFGERERIIVNCGASLLKGEAAVLASMRACASCRRSL